MPIEELLARKKALQDELDRAHKKEISFGNYYSLAKGALFWASVVFSASATVLAVIPNGNVTKWQLAILTALAVACQGVSSQARLHYWAYWHYRKSDALGSLASRLRFELPVDFTADQVAGISRDKRNVIDNMTSEGNDTQSTENLKMAHALYSNAKPAPEKEKADKPKKVGLNNSVCPIEESADQE